jgi:hypothetical protein
MRHAQKDLNEPISGLQNKTGKPKTEESKRYFKLINMKQQMKYRQTLDLQIFRFSISILIFTVFMTSCNSKSENRILSLKGSSDSISLAETQNAALDSIVYFLLDVSAKDFHDHQPPVPIGFRDVQIKYLIKPNEEKTYLLYGQFLNQDNQNKEEWTHFVTIKTDPYEQWIGSNALTYCLDSKGITYTKIDLSIALKSRYDSLQNSTK